MSVETTRCALHPAAASRLTCARCGRFTCAACVSPSAELCRQCFDRPQERLGSSRRARLALALAVLGLQGLLPCALAALLLVRAERAAIERNAAPRGGEPLLTGATWLAWGALGLWSVLAGIFFSRQG